MFQKLLLSLLIIDCFVLAAAVLLQSGKGTGMAASFGGVSSSPDAFIGTRQAGNLLTRIGWWSGGIFLAVALVLQISSARARVPKSVLDQAVTPPAAPATPAPGSAAPALPFQAAPSAAPGATAPSSAPATAPAHAPAKTAPAKPTPAAPAP
jgi:preprotein translocase subunit SecG